MSTSDPTKRSGVNWWDLPGPDSYETRLTVAWLDERDKEFAYTFRGMHAYWMAQVFKARDATIKAQSEEVSRLTHRIGELEAERDRHGCVICADPTNLEAQGYCPTHGRETREEMDELEAEAERLRGQLAVTERKHAQACEDAVKCGDLAEKRLRRSEAAESSLSVALDWLRRGVEGWSADDLRAVCAFLHPEQKETAK